MRPAGSKVVAVEDLPGVAAHARESGRRVALAKGVFDVLHPGIVRYLDRARSAADLLAVAVLGALVERGRPLVAPEARAHLVAAIRSVDHVVVVPGDDVSALIRSLRPDVLCTTPDALPTAAEAEALRGCEARWVATDWRQEDERLASRGRA